MRKFQYLLTITTAIVLITFHGAKAQSSKANGFNANNRQNNTDFLGWQATSALPGPLQIKNDIPNQPINLFAGGTQRMTILGTNGFVGIGKGFITPTSLLHLDAFNNNTGNLFRSDGLNTINNEWAMYTGTNTVNPTV